MINESLRPYLVLKKNVLGLNEVKNQKAQAYFNFDEKQLVYTGAKITDLELYDITGKLILLKENIEQNSEINLSQFSLGIYFAVFTSENKTTSLKMVF